MSLQKIRLRIVKNVIFSLLCILVDRPIGGGGFEIPKPPPAYAFALGGPKIQPLSGSTVSEAEGLFTLPQIGLAGSRQ